MVRLNLKDSDNSDNWFKTDAFSSTPSVSPIPSVPDVDASANEVQQHQTFTDAEPTSTTAMRKTTPAEISLRTVTQPLSNTKLPRTDPSESKPILRGAGTKSAIDKTRTTRRPDVASSTSLQLNTGHETTRTYGLTHTKRANQKDQDQIRATSVRKAETSSITSGATQAVEAGRESTTAYDIMDSTGNSYNLDENTRSGKEDVIHFGGYDSERGQSSEDRVEAGGGADYPEEISANVTDNIDIQVNKQIEAEAEAAAAAPLQETFDDNFKTETEDEDRNSEDSTDANADPNTDQHENNEQFYIAAIHAHDRARCIGNKSYAQNAFLVEWQGYPLIKDLTWEPETKVEEAAPAIVAEYRRYLRKDAVAKRREVKVKKVYNFRGREKRRGRPRKNAQKSKASSRKSGRPRKYGENAQGESRGVESSKISIRGRGRPRKTIGNNDNISSSSTAEV